MLLNSCFRSAPSYPGGWDAVAWGKVAQIVASWVTSPLLGGVLAFGVFQIVRRLVLDREDPMGAAKRTGPFFFFVVTFVIGLVTLFKGLKNLKLDLDLPEALLASTLLGLLGAVAGRMFLKRIPADSTGKASDRFRVPN